MVRFEKKRLMEKDVDRPRAARTSAASGDRSGWSGCSRSFPGAALALAVLLLLCSVRRLRDGRPDLRTHTVS